ncbi:MAG: DUF3987 domain-containing protein [Cyclobacteriaceae bacterium]|nr:DUF3987 domain-containing protein [Cyclobacteriaceae bacterium]
MINKEMSENDKLESGSTVVPANNETTRETESAGTTRNNLVTSSDLKELPQPLKGICELASNDEERDLLFISTLGVLSGCISVTGVYDKQRFYPNLFVIVTAPPASGKGVMKYARKLFNPFGEMVKKLPEPFGKSRVFLPANTSSAALHAALVETQGAGVIFETEAVTLTNALGQDWGSFTDLLLKAFQQEPISLMRKGSGGPSTFIEIETPRISLVLSGTPTQLWPLIESVAGGLFSRFFFFELKPNYMWRDVSPKGSNGAIDDRLAPIQDCVKENLIFDAQNPFEMMLSEGQWDVLNCHFSEMMKNLVPIHPELHSSVKRLGLGAFKVCMVLTALRRAERKDQSSTVECDDWDFELALHLTDVFAKVALKHISDLPIQADCITVGKGQRLLQEIQKFPNEFTSLDLVEAAKRLEIDSRTMYLDLAALQPKYVEKLKNGRYRKVKGS